MAPNGDAPDAVKNNPALAGLNLDFSTMGKPERAPLMVTKSLLFSADGAGLFNSGPGGGGRMFRAHDKATGKVVFQMALPSNVTVWLGRSSWTLPRISVGVPSTVPRVSLRLRMALTRATSSRGLKGLVT